MTTVIRRWQDSDFYLSQAGTANVREQLIKLQSIGKLVRALSDASTVDTNGDKLQDRLLGLSLGDLTQRHKYRVLYDNLNDRFLVQRNSGTDASKVWVELLRIDASGNATTTGNLLTEAVTTGGKLTLGGDLDANQFYFRNVDDMQTRTLRVTTQLTLPNNHTPGWVYIASKTAANSPLIDFTGLTQYPKYMITLDQVQPSADGGVFLMQVSTNNGASFLGSAVYSSAGVAHLNFGGGVQEQISTAGVTAWQPLGDGGFNQDNAGTSAITGTIQLNALGSASTTARGRAQLEFIETNGLFVATSDVGLFASPGAAINGVRFAYFSGVITSGTFRLYGLRNS